MNSKNSIKRWYVGLRHCVELLPQPGTMGMREACKLVCPCKQRNGLECAKPHYRISFLILSRGEWVSSLFTPIFLKPAQRPSKNYALCLIPDMDWTRQSVCQTARQTISSTAKQNWSEWKTQHIKSNLGEWITVLDHEGSSHFCTWQGLKKNNKKSHTHMLTSSHGCISMQGATNARKNSQAYLNKTAAFLISCFWNSAQKVKPVYEYRLR